MIVRPYSGYFDESGSDANSSVISAAGWLGTYQTWIVFDRDWKAFIKRKTRGESQEFHYTDFWARRTYGADWSDIERLDFVKSLAQLTRQYAIYGIGFALNKADYNAALPLDVRRVLKNDPYYFCVGHIASMVLSWYERIPVAPPAKPIHFLFHRKKGSEGRAAEVFYQVKEWFDRNNLIGQMAFGESAEWPGLQAADLLGGELRRQIQGKISEVLPIFERLVFAAPKREQLSARANELLAQLRSQSRGY